MVNSSNNARGVTEAPGFGFIGLRQQLQVLPDNPVKGAKVALVFVSANSIRDHAFSFKGIRRYGRSRIGHTGISCAVGTGIPSKETNLFFVG